MANIKKIGEGVMWFAGGLVGSVIGWNVITPLFNVITETWIKYLGYGVMAIIIFLISFLGPINHIQEGLKE